MLRNDLGEARIAILASGGGGGGGQGEAEHPSSRSRRYEDSASGSASSGSESGAEYQGRHHHRRRDEGKDKSSHRSHHKSKRSKRKKEPMRMLEEGRVESRTLEDQPKRRRPLLIETEETSGAHLDASNLLKASRPFSREGFGDEEDGECNLSSVAIFLCAFLLVCGVLSFIAWAFYHARLDARSHSDDASYANNA
jgi:hypothetical protein